MTAGSIEKHKPRVEEHIREVFDITHFGIYQRLGDTSLLILYLEVFKERYGLKNLNDHIVVTDAGYGSEQNYEYIGKEKVTGIIFSLLRNCSTILMLTLLSVRWAAYEFSLQEKE